ncbi:MAG TPA: 4-hydroxy-3-methylbut-2-enyl diphosphate reductase [Candidatus Elarobacter sp.]|jgi:4-hydroxy-3-methylbut-2-enyl diphosphate reductase|nr:4-hydroxy-3-methylbut-2-enyl diphosphate reductase [Candidatus Elarobacter sp.]
MRPQILVARTRGYCAGVARAVGAVEDLLAESDGPVYVRHAIVHNTRVVNELAERGAVFVERNEDVPAGAALVLSAHGSAPAVVDDARERGLRIVDATCPLVTKVHREVARFVDDGYTVLIIGDPNHVETIGVAGVRPGRAIVVPDEASAEAIEPPSRRLAVVAQTTLDPRRLASVLAVLQRRFTGLALPSRSDICYATVNRQSAARELARAVQRAVVVGSGNSANSRHLREVIEEEGCPAVLIDDVALLDLAAFAGLERIGVTAGASAPETLVDEIVGTLATSLGAEVTEFGPSETPMTFAPVG